MRGGAESSRASAASAASVVSSPVAAGPSRASVVSSRGGALLELIGEVERVRTRLAGLQAVLEVEYRAEQVRAQEAAGVAREQRGRGVAEELALVRGVSPKKAGDQLALRRVLVESMPRTFAKVLSGEVKAWAAEQAAQAAVVLEEEDRACLDAELAVRLPQLNPASARGAARKIADRLDQRAALRRLERAESQRHVSIRPVADGMVRLSALLPTRAGVAVYAALKKLAAANTTTTTTPTTSASTAPAPASGTAGAGLGRSAGQVMADALVERVTGVADPGEVAVEVQLVMSDRTLLAGGADTALLEGMPIPGEAARALALHLRGPGAESGPARFVRRLFTDPVTGRLTGMDARRRVFTGAVREFIRARDQVCRVPFCGARIRDIDHVRRYADGGPTTIENGVGLCQRHNLAKEMPGWNAHLDAGTGVLHLDTPSGARAHSRVPDLHALIGTPFGATATSPPHAGPAPGENCSGNELDPPSGERAPADDVGPPGRNDPPADIDQLDETELSTDTDPPGHIDELDATNPPDDLSDTEIIELLRDAYTAWGITA